MTPQSGNTPLKDPALAGFEPAGTCKVRERRSPVEHLNGREKMRAKRLTGSIALCLTLGLVVACGAGDTATTDTPVPGCPRLIDDHSVALDNPPDGAAACAMGDCNYQTQDGCADDQACRP